MSILPLKRKEVIDNAGKAMRYFVRTKESEDGHCAGEDLLEAIRGAKETICFAATAEVDDSVRKAILERVDKRVRVYGLFSEFGRSTRTVAWFDDKNPALVRSNGALQNDFVVIDRKEAFLFVNPLERLDGNICIKFVSEGAADLFYWFTYWFWNSDEKERILKEVRSCKEAPFSVPVMPKGIVNISESLKHPFAPSVGYYPNQPKLRTRMNEEKVADDKLARRLSSRISVPVYEDATAWKIGDMIFPKKDFNGVPEVWEERNGTLRDAPVEFIDFDADNWSPVRKEQKAEKKLSEAVRPSKIEDMENAKPSGRDLAPMPYALETTVEYVVEPPRKPEDAKAAAIYGEYGVLESGHVQNVERILKELGDMESKSEKTKSPGLSKEILEMKASIEKEKQTNFRELKVPELEAVLARWNIAIPENWIVKLVDMKVQLKKLEYEKEKDEKIEKNEAEIAKKLKGAGSASNKALNREIEKLRDESDRERRRLFPDEERRKEFLSSAGRDFKKLTAPRYLLPEVGTLFENKDGYYLEIAELGDLELANEIAAQRYKDKTCRVVAKEEK
ncbi:MAG: hypothetical protein J6T45_01400 [Fibrobacterales bacterium]|nr:hypothetical protein [Fibrobacterales bacterium]